MDEHGMNEDITSAAIATKYQMILQLCSRVATFLLNGFIVHYMPKEVLGLVNVRLMLLYSTIQFLSREGFRRSCSKGFSRNGLEWKRTINLIWLSVPVSIVFGGLFATIWIYSLPCPGFISFEKYVICVLLFTSAAIVETCAEPFFITCQAEHFDKVRAVIQGFALIVEVVINAVAAIYFGVDAAVIFCVSHFCMSFLVLVMYVVYFKLRVHGGKNGFGKELVDFFPHFGSGLAENKFALVWSFTKQSCIKQVLTEGERYFMTLTNVFDLQKQGVYDVINNLGSLLPRMVFQPMEENAYRFFSSACIRGNEKASTNEAKKIQNSLLFYLHASRLMAVISFGVLCFGSVYSYVLLSIYGGEELAKRGSSLLQTYCVFVVVLAWNGLSEAYAFAIMDKRSLEKHNWKLAMVSIIMLLSQVVFANLLNGDPIALVCGNIVNMLCRILLSFKITSSYLKTHNISTQDYAKIFFKSLAPSFPVSIWLAVVTFLCYMTVSYSHFPQLGFNIFSYRAIIPLGFGGCCGISYLLSVYIFERESVEYFFGEKLKHE